MKTPWKAKLAFILVNRFFWLNIAFDSPGGSLASCKKGSRANRLMIRALGEPRPPSIVHEQDVRDGGY